MKLPKPIADWRHVFLDISIVIDYTSSPSKITKNAPHRERVEFVHQIMEIILFPTDKKKLTLYLSAISIGELRKVQPDGNIFKQIVTLFNASDVVVVDYTKDVAVTLNKSLERYLPENNRFHFEKNLEKMLNSEHFQNARQWIADDMKICACAKSLTNLDVVLTTDKKTFVPIAEKMGLPCVPVYPEYFPKNLFGDIDELEK